MSRHLIFLSQLAVRCCLTALLAIAGAIAVTGAQAAENAELRLATTTSTEASGLLKFILPRFEAKTGIKVRVVAVGSGKAMQIGEAGDADVLLVHARASEDKFMAGNHGTLRKDVMYNDFLMVGPTSDPAKIKGSKDVLAAMKMMASSGAKFISRGDNSGTDQMEKAYWKQIGIEPKGQAWFVSAGLGMGEVLNMAAQLNAYTLTDRATYGAYKMKTGLTIAVEGDPKMFNPYGVIAANPSKSEKINAKGAMEFVNWITSAEGQQAIAAYKVDGEQLFFPLDIK
jgi:tungstate transport system substrate-binding protein